MKHFSALILSLLICCLASGNLVAQQNEQHIPAYLPSGCVVDQVISQVSLNGQGNSVTVDPGDEVTVYLNLQASYPTSCSTIANESYYVYYGFSSGETQCFTMYIVNPGGSRSAYTTALQSLSAPEQPGTYYLNLYENMGADCVPDASALNNSSEYAFGSVTVRDTGSASSGNGGTPPDTDSTGCCGWSNPAVSNIATTDDVTIGDAGNKADLQVYGSIFSGTTKVIDANGNWVGATSAFLPVVAAPLTGTGTSASPLTLGQMGAVSGQVLKWNGTTWLPANDAQITYAAGTGISISNGEISAENSSPIWNAEQLQGESISVGTPAAGQVLTFDGTQWLARAPEAAASGWEMAPGAGDTTNLYTTVNGRVGIGTSAPAAKLDIYGMLAINGQVVINDTGAWVGPVAIDPAAQAVMDSLDALNAELDQNMQAIQGAKDTLQMGMNSINAGMDQIAQGQALLEAAENSADSAAAQAEIAAGQASIEAGQSQINVGQASVAATAAAISAGVSVVSAIGAGIAAAVAVGAAAEASAAALEASAAAAEATAAAAEATVAAAEATAMAAEATLMALDADIAAADADIAAGDADVAAADADVAAGNADVSAGEAEASASAAEGSADAAADSATEAGEQARSASSSADDARAAADSAAASAQAAKDAINTELEGDVSGKIPTTRIVKLQGQTLQLTAPTEGQVLTFRDSSWQAHSLETQVLRAGTGIRITGDSIFARTDSALWNADALHGQPLASQAPDSLQVLRWNGEAWTPADLDLPESEATGWRLDTNQAGDSILYSTVQGNLGIGTTQPQGILHVQHGPDSLNHVLIMDSLGAVGIGTFHCDPAFRLSVGGAIRAKKVVIESGWADYVFADDYALLPLDEVARYIQQHRHLPGIPSADVVEAEGLDVATMQVAMMEKIEELTLYLIDLKQENEDLRRKVEALEAFK